jgi:hypothetical protein
MGGIGKTQLALEYSHRYRYGGYYYSTIFWVDAKNPESSGRRILEQIILHYVKGSTSRPNLVYISKELGIPYSIDSSGAFKQEFEALSSTWHVVKRWLSKNLNTKWLLMIDNIDCLHEVNILNFLPTCNWGRIIFISRRPNIGILVHALPVTEISDDLGLSLLITGVKRNKQDLSAAGE